MDPHEFNRARSEFAADRHAFVLQHGHLTTTPADGFRPTGKQVSEPYEYGIAFTPRSYLHEHWGAWFRVVDYREGAIHDFQDIAVLTPKSSDEVRKFGV